MWISRNQFEIWSVDSTTPDYIECLVYERKKYYYCYINIHKDTRFIIDYTVAPKKSKEETVEEQIYRAEWMMYETRKDMGQPLFKLHKTTYDKMLEALK